MKIYTEINYEWQDGHLIEISSESFNYNGPLTFCTGGAADTAEDLIENPVGTVSTALEVKKEEAKEGTEEFIAENTDSLNDMESGINTGVDDLHDYGKAVNTVVADELTRWSDAAMKFGKELGEFMGVGGDDGDDVAVPEKLKAVKRGLKNKAVANLKVNKSLGRARSSLRIDG